jgi:hypothetical protein
MRLLSFLKKIGNQLHVFIVPPIKPTDIYGIVSASAEYSFPSAATSRQNRKS